MTIRLLIIDDCRAPREDIAALLESEPGIATTGGADTERGIAVFRSLRPDIVLMDLPMPGMGGLKDVRALRAEFPTARIIVLAAFPGEANAREAMMAGAMGYLAKNASRSELAACIREVARGGRYVSAAVPADVATSLGAEALTARESVILGLLAEGMENRRIGSRLGISAQSVKSQLTRLFEKLGARNRIEAVDIALARGVLDGGPG